MEQKALFGLALVALVAAACGSPGSTPPPPPAFTTEGFLASERESESNLAVTDESVPPAQDSSAASSNPPDTTEAAAAPDETVPRYTPVGRVAGSELYATDLLQEWNDISSREVWLVVERIVTTRLALAEAQRLGIRLDPEGVEERVAREERELAAEVVRRGLDLTPEDFIRRELRMDPDRYRQRLRRATIHQLLTERAVRTASLSAESLRVRVIVVPGTEEMAEVTRALEAGADFSELARRHSVDDSAAQGGLVPFVVWQEHAPLARLAFRTEVGEIGGPVEAAEHHFLVRVEERRPAVEGPWSIVRSTVEASLAEFPVSDGEFLTWKLSIEDRYPVDLQPLVDLLGTAR